MARPAYLDAIEANDPDLLEVLGPVTAPWEADGALPARVKTLMVMLADSLLAHPDGVKSLAGKARAQGASEEEIKETVRMALVCGGLPALVTATKAFEK